jgi:hypothetical protein
MNDKVIKTSKYSLDVVKTWPYIEGKSLSIFVEYIVRITEGIEKENIVYYNNKLTNREQGKITGFANCISRVCHMVNED